MSGLHEKFEFYESASQILTDSNTRSLSGKRINSRRSRCSVSESLLRAANFDDKADSYLLSNEPIPDMWSWNYIGLYCQYAAVGLLYGSSAGSCYAFCSYVYDGSSNVCANAKSIIFFAWSFKLFFAILTDTVRPFGLRRKPWMLFGWCGVLALLLFMAIFSEKLSVSTWLASLLTIQVLMMLSDVPADGYSVELGQLEPAEQRGQILATGQRIRFTFSMIAGVIQTFLLNGPTTNAPDCTISTLTCWSWGLTSNQYYGLLFAIVALLTIPIFYLKEPDAKNFPRHSLGGLLKELWETMTNLTTFNLIVFVIGIGFAQNYTNVANIYLQYYVINLTNFQAGIDSITSYLVLVGAVYIFQKYLINKNWRITEYGSVVVSAVLGLLWIFAYYNVGGTMNAWYTIFIDLDVAFTQGLSQVLYSMSVIELARKGQEATTYELVISVANTAATAAQIVVTQLLTPLHAAGCTTDSCPSDTVDITSQSNYESSDGPWRFTVYCLTLFAMAVGGSLIFVPFLPASKEECAEWKLLGEKRGDSAVIGWTTAVICVIIISYGIAVAILLLDPDTSCEPAVGGSGC